MLPKLFCSRRHIAIVWKPRKRTWSWFCGYRMSYITRASEKKFEWIPLFNLNWRKPNQVS